MPYILQTDRLTKIIGEKELVRDVDLHVRKGEIYGFLGPNGAGKTTVMKLVTNLWKPTGGCVLLFGEPLTPTSYGVLKRMGSIIEFPTFYPHMTGRENLQIHCDYMGYSRPKGVEEALEQLELDDAADRPVGSYSLGMKQRLGIARALLCRPELLILDEPTNGLDPAGIKQVRDLLKRMREEYEMTVMVSSHILGEMEAMADTVGIIHRGRMREEISLRELEGRGTSYLHLTVDDPGRASVLLSDVMHLGSFRVMKGGIIRIYDRQASPPGGGRRPGPAPCGGGGDRKKIGDAGGALFEADIGGGQHMGKLIELEWRKNRIGNWVRWAALLGAALGLLIFAMAFLGIANDPETGVPDAAPGHGGISSPIELLTSMCFLVFTGVMLSVFIVGAYQNGTMSLVFSYPVRRQKLLAAQMLAVWIFCFGALAAAKLLLYGCVLAGSRFLPSAFPLDFDMTRGAFYGQLLLRSAVTVTEGFIALFAGLALHSARAAIVTSFLLVLLTQANIGSFTMADSAVFPAVLTGISLLCALLSLRGAETRDLM